MTGPQPHKDRWIPWYFVAFFVVLAIIDGFFVALAVSTHKGTVTDNAYQKGLNYNRLIEAAEKQEKLGWQSSVDYKDGQIQVSLKDKEGHFLNQADMTLYLSNVSTQGHEFQQPLTADATTNLFSAPIKFPLPGLWDIRIVAGWKGQTFQQGQRLEIPQE